MKYFGVFSVIINFDVNSDKSEKNGNLKRKTAMYENKTSAYIAVCYVLSFNDWNGGRGDVFIQ